MACGASRSETAPALTAADVPAAEAPAEKTSAPAAEQAATPTAAPPPAGELVCRGTNDEGTAELYVEWKGDSGKGLLRRVAPSGMVYEQAVEVERAPGTILADEPGNLDLAKHAAIVHTVNGKPHIRVGDRSHAWARCE
jgi:hypothetical protein